MLVCFFLTVVSLYTFALILEFCFLNISPCGSDWWRTIHADILFRCLYKPVCQFSGKVTSENKLLKPIWFCYGPLASENCDWETTGIKGQPAGGIYWTEWLDGRQSVLLQHCTIERTHCRSRSLHAGVLRGSVGHLMPMVQCSENGRMWR